jgi:hypothetical protein
VRRRYGHLPEALEAAEIASDLYRHQLVIFDTMHRTGVANLDGFARVHGVWAVPQLGRVYAFRNIKQKESEDEDLDCCYVLFDGPADSARAVAFVFSESREANVAQNVLEGFQGVLVSDFYTGYDSIASIQQRCLVHLTWSGEAK